MARDNGRRGAYFHTDDAARERQQKQQTIQLEHLISPAFVSSPTSNSHDADKKEDITPNVTVTSVFRNVLARNEYVHKLTDTRRAPDVNGANFNGSSSSDPFNHSSRISHHSTAADRFFDHAPEELNTRFPVINNHETIVVPGPFTPDNVPQRRSFLGRYSPISLFSATTIRWTSVQARPANEAEFERFANWKGFLVIYITLLVTFGCFMIIMLDGMCWILSLVWGWFCEAMDWFLD